MTSYLLRSQRTPLGTLNRETWENAIDAFDSWTTLAQQSSNGYAIITAERLLERLQYELLVSSSVNPDYNARVLQLQTMRMTIIHAWLNIHTSYPSSTMALERAENLYIKLIETSPLLPVPELLDILDYWLGQETSLGSERAATLLLEVTTDPYHFDLADHASVVGERFDSTIISLLQTVDLEIAATLNTQLLGRIDDLKRNFGWDGLRLSDATLTALDEHFYQQAIEEPLEATTSSHLGTKEESRISFSSFEAEAMQKRMIDMLKKGGANDKESIAKLIPRVEALESPNDQLVGALLDYYLRVEDAINASVWILRLTPDQIILKQSADDSAATRLDQLLDVWLQEPHQRAPWRAEEVFRQILDGVGEGNIALSTSTMNRLLKIWHQSGDPASHRKVREWFSRMTESMNMKPDGSSLYYALAAMDENSPTSDAMYESILIEWGSWSDDEKKDVAALLVESLQKARRLPRAALEILARIVADDLGLSRQTCLPLLRQAFSRIAPEEILDTMERLVESPGLRDLTFHEAAIHSVIKDTRKYLDIAESVWRNAFEVTKKEPTIIKSGELSAFLGNVMQMYKFRKLYDAGEVFILAAEELFLIENYDGTDENISLIPLDAYKSLIVRNWFRQETSDRVIAICERVIELYKNGFNNLRPDQEFYAAYIHAKSVIANDPDELVEVLNEMVALYENSNNEASCKPNAAVFNPIFLVIKSKISSSKEAWRQSLKLWQRMEALDVAPDTKTLSILILCATKGENQKSAFSTIVDLYKKFEEHKLEPDSRTYHAIISACGLAKEGDQEALNLCLKVFGEIRKRGETTIFTYASLTKSLRRLLPKGPLADKVATSTLELCCRDGLLAPEVREAYQSMINSATWQKIYGQNLTEKNEEPDDWHRHLPNSS